MKTSLYRFYADDDTLLYVGQSRNPFQRLSGHFADKQMDQVRHIELEWFDTPSEAISAEAWAIRREKPLWNVIAPVKPRKVRVTPKAGVKRVRVAQQRPAPQYYANIGPHLPPVQGPPKPWKRYGVGDVSGCDVDYSFDADKIETAFKVARKGDVIIFGSDIKATVGQIRALIEGQVYSNAIN